MWEHVRIQVVNIVVGGSDAVVSQILDELGLQLNDTLSGLPQATGSLSVPG